MTNEELRKAIDKYQKEHPLHFGTVLDVTTISSKESADIISETIERISEKVNEDTELWCICEMAKMYMQGVKPVYPVRQHGEWITIEAGEDLLEDHYWYLIAHKDYGTPMKAKYHSDCPHFTFFDARGERATYLFEDKVTHYMELPDIPQEAKNESKN